MGRQLRRVVTGHDATGKSIFIMDGPPPHPYDTGRGSGGGVIVNEMWETRSTPADNSGAEETTDHTFSLYPPKDGSVFRVIEYPPDRVRFAASNRSHYAEMGAPDAGDRHRAERGFHRTDTVDYCIVIEGEIYALMDETEVLLRAGDVLIQRGTNHAWSNRCDKSAIVAFAMINAQPVKLDRKYGND